MAEGGKEAVRTDDTVVGAAEVRALERCIRELERGLGRKTLESEILREAVKVAHEKTDLAVAVVTRRGFPMKAVATTLGVSRSQLHERLQGRSRPRRRYAKADGGELLPAIRVLVNERPTLPKRKPAPSGQIDTTPRYTISARRRFSVEKSRKLKRTGVLILYTCAPAIST